MKQSSLGPSMFAILMVSVCLFEATLAFWVIAEIRGGSMSAIADGAKLVS